MTQTTTPTVGDTVTGKPLGQTRRQTMVVSRVDGDYLHGYLVSRKYPGNYRGAATMLVTEVTR